ncbi:hypothetical protein TcWFU_007890 [Taenia crassiceps]|uniref:Uncharacterized protein n=1 Tax=Taenia crassiceps TaxID=6207 RepID=A0ABR4QE53_9CEST
MHSLDPTPQRASFMSLSTIYASPASRCRETMTSEPPQKMSCVKRSIINARILFKSTTAFPCWLAHKNSLTRLPSIFLAETAGQFFEASSSDNKPIYFQKVVSRVASLAEKQLSCLDEEVDNSKSNSYTICPIVTVKKLHSVVTKMFALGRNHEGSSYRMQQYQN